MFPLSPRITAVSKKPPAIILPFLLLIPGLLAAPAPLSHAAEEVGSPVKACVYWDHVEQRPGRTEDLFVRLEADTAPGEPLVVRLTLPPGVSVGADGVGWWQNLWDKIMRPNDALERGVAVTEWRRGEVVAPKIKSYFVNRRVPEKHLSATVSWKVRSQQPLDAQGMVEISTPGREPQHLPVRFDFRGAPENAGTGRVPPPVPAEHDYLVGALYYPGWEPGQGSGWSLLDPFPERKPALGYHDGGSVDVANWEIKWALENGVNFFVYCWYVLGDKKPAVGNLFLGRTLHEGVMKSPFRDKFHFALLWCAGNSSGVTRERLLGEFLPFWIENYFKNPGYLLVGGKPVLFVYDLDVFIAQQGGAAAAKESVALMREAMVAAGFKGIWLVGEYRYKDPAAFKKMHTLGLDASFPYCYGFPKPKQNQEALDAIMEVSRRQDAISPIPVIGTAAVSWDPQPWIDYMDYPWHSVPFWLDPPHFKKQVELMKKRMDARTDNSPLAGRMLLIDNWNEYGEGHWVAPSRKEGFRYLNAIRDVFAPQASKRPNIMLEDVGLSPDESAYNAWREKMREKLK